MPTPPPSTPHGATSCQACHGRLEVPVRGSDEDDALVGLKPVHLNQKLIERLFAFIVSAAQPRASVAAHRVDLVDEDNTGRVLLTLLKKVAHAARTDAHKHLHEVGPRNAEERNARLTGDAFREQGLTGPRRPHEEHPLWNPPA